jgi:hypothetical protein
MRSLDGVGDQIGGAVEMTDTVFSRRLSVKQKFVLNSKYWGQSPNALNISSNGGPSAFKVRGPLEHAQASDPQRRADRPPAGWMRAKPMLRSSREALLYLPI